MPTALITGASQGLGRALARSLAHEGWQLVIDARDPGRLAAAAADIGSGLIAAIPGDVSDADHRRALLDAVPGGSLDLLVNNASILGASPQPPLSELPLEVFREVLEVNVVAPLALMQASLPLLRAAGGRVLNITSDAGVEGYPGWGAYGASKAALEQLSRVFAAEHPELKTYWVDPGDMNTTMHQEAYPGEDISDRPAPEASVPGLLELVHGGHPSGRYAARELVPA